MPPLQFGQTGNFQNAPAEAPVVEQQPAPAPPPYDPATGMPQHGGDGDGIPNEYGDGPDLDGNGVPVESGINPDNSQPGYPGGEVGDTTTDGISVDGGEVSQTTTDGIVANGGEVAALDPIPSASVEWGGVAVPDPTVVPQSGATTTGAAEAMPEEEYGDGSAPPDGNWVPEETGIDPYALQQPAYADPSTSGDGTGDSYGRSSFEPYVLRRRKPPLRRKPRLPKGKIRTRSGRSSRRTLGT